MRFITNKNTLILASLLAIGISGCKKEDFAINTNPDDITESTVDFKAVLPASLAATATIQSTQFTFLQKWLGYWARSGSYQDITDEETYSFTNDFGSGIWNNYYSNATNYNFVVNKAKAAGAGKYEAIGRIMRALDFQVLVDVYGNIPYTQALQGTAFRTPAYDDDAAIYTDLFRQLDTAIVLLNDDVLSSNLNNPSIAINDLVFAGDATNWKKFANTLKLRLLMHMANTTFTGSTEVNTFVAGANQVEEMQKITDEGSGFLGAGLNAHINPGYNDTKPNPFYRAFVKTETGALPGAGDQTKANAYAMGNPSTGPNPGYYGYNGDPRAARFYAPPTGGGAPKGILYGELAVAGSPNIGNNLSNIGGPGLVPAGAASRAWIITGFESLFLQSEAAYRGLLTTNGTAASLLTAAVRENFVWLGLTAAQADAYLALNAGYVDVDITAPPLHAGLPAGGMYTILSQKWFALNAIATLEVWTDYRRSDIVYGIGSDFEPGPAISVNPANTKTKIPIRLFYPQNEYSYNPGNVTPEGIIDVFTAGGVAGRNRIFWDKN